jgi:hypothetical protein
MAMIRNEETGRFGEQGGREGEAFGLSPLNPAGPVRRKPDRSRSSGRSSTLLKENAPSSANPKALRARLSEGHREDSTARLLRDPHLARDGRVGGRPLNASSSLSCPGNQRVASRDGRARGRRACPAVQRRGLAARPGRAQADGSAGEWGFEPGRARPSKARPPKAQQPPVESPPPKPSNRQPNPLAAYPRSSAAIRRSSASSAA